MEYNDASRKIKTLDKERTTNLHVKDYPIIAPELDEDILKFLKERSMPGDRDSISVFDFSSNNSFSIIWVNDGTYSEYVKEN